MRPTVRYLCRALAPKNGPDLAPTIVAGLGSIIAPYDKRTSDEWVNGHLTILVGAIYWFVSESARLAPGEEMTAETSRARYTSMRKEIMGALRGARNEVEVSSDTRGRKAKLTEEGELTFWRGWQDTIKVANFDEAITEVTNKGWLNSDWYRSIDFLREKADGGDKDDDTLGQDSTSAAANVQIAKADTMFQDKFDYLSERRRADYRQWKASILRRIELLERGQGKDAMDVGS